MLCTLVNIVQVVLLQFLFRFIIHLEKETRWVRVLFIILELALILIIIKILERVHLLDLLGESAIFIPVSGTVQVQIRCCIAVY